MTFTVMIPHWLWDSVTNPLGYALSIAFWSGVSIGRWYERKRTAADSKGGAS